jgi:hypothetical protein
MLSNEPFTISVTEGRWPNRVYFSIIPGTPLFQCEDKDSYTDWLFSAVQSDETVADAVREIMDAIVEGKTVRLIVPNRKTDFRGEVILNLINQYLEAQEQ